MPALIGVGQCSLDITLNYRNVDTGSFTAHANGPGFWGNSGYSALFSPGNDNFVGTVTVNAAHFPEPGAVPPTTPTRVSGGGFGHRVVGREPPLRECRPVVICKDAPGSRTRPQYSAEYARGHTISL